MEWNLEGYKKIANPIHNQWGGTYLQMIAKRKDQRTNSVHP